MSICSEVRALVLAAIFAWGGFASRGDSAMADDGIKVFVKGLVCGFCAQGLTKTVRRHPYVDDLAVDVDKGVLFLRLKAGKTLSAHDIAGLVKSAGFEMERVEYPMDEM